MLILTHYLTLPDMTLRNLSSGNQNNYVLAKPSLLVKPELKVNHIIETLRLRFSQFLGKISFTVYLTHIPVRQYLIDYQKMDMNLRSPEIETVMFVIGATFVWSAIYTYVIEECIIRKFICK